MAIGLGTFIATSIRLTGADKEDPSQETCPGYGEEWVVAAEEGADLLLDLLIRLLLRPYASQRMVRSARDELSRRCRAGGPRRK